jgi:hypothetical protein
VNLEKKVRSINAGLTNNITLALVVFLTLIVLVPFFQLILGSFKPYGPENIPNDRAQLVYQTLEQEDSIIDVKNIKVIEISDSGISNMDKPFFKLSPSLTKNFLNILLIFGIAGIILSVLSAVMFRELNKKDIVWYIKLAFWNLLGSGIILYTIVSKPMGLWDETYVMASAAKNFSISGIPGVPITGPQGVAEASVDLIVIILAGLFLVINRSLEADTSLLLSAILINSIFATFISVILRKKYYFKPGQSIAFGFVLLLNPAAISTLMGGMPTVVAVFAWPLYGLAFFYSIVNKNYSYLVITSLVLLLVRWELGVVATLSCLAIYFTLLITKTKNPILAHEFQYKNNSILLAPLIVFLLLTLLRIQLFGSYVPSGLLGKSVGLDSAYIQTGLIYFRETLIDSMWLLVMLVIVSFSLSYLKKSYVRSFLITAGILMIPAVIFLPGGKDWFLVGWSRYTLPSAAAIVVLAITLFGSKIYAVFTPKLIWVVSCFLIFLVQLPGIMKIYNLKDPEQVSYRIDCLAKAGKSLKLSFPDVKSVATAEVNTIAYFAEIKLTDLIGLVDPRTASVPKSPLAPGDPFHRKSNFEIIKQDKPDSIYLYEGADCDQVDFSAEEDVLKWNELVNSDVSRFRAGNFSYILENYTPVTIVVPNQMQVRFLIKNNLITG